MDVTFKDVTHQLALLVMIKGDTIHWRCDVRNGGLSGDSKRNAASNCSIMRSLVSLDQTQ